MKTQAFLRLERSESAVLEAASRIYAAYITSGAVTQENQGQYELLSMKTAIRMAVMADEMVQSDDEQGGDLLASLRPRPSAPHAR